MIIPVKDLKFVEYLPELLQKIKELPYTIEEYINYIVTRLASDDSLLLLDIEDKVKGFLFAEIIFNMKPEVFIVAAYNNGRPKAGKEMLSIVERWARLNNINTVSTLTNPKNIKAYERKYNFKFTDAYLTKELNNEQSIQREKTKNGGDSASLS